MDLFNLCDQHGTKVQDWPDYAQREAVAALFREDESWLCDSFDSFTPEQFKRMVAALSEDNTAARLLMLGTVLDELFSAGMLHDAIQRRVDDFADEQAAFHDPDAYGDWLYHQRKEARA